MSYFSRRIQFDKIFGDNFRFQSAEFGEERPTMKEAIQAVEDDIKDYTQTKAKQLNLKVLNELPF